MSRSTYRHSRHRRPCFPDSGRKTSGARAACSCRNPPPEKYDGVADVEKVTKKEKKKKKKKRDGAQPRETAPTIAPVTHLGDVASRHHNVVGLQVSVDAGWPLPMQVGHAIGRVVHPSAQQGQASRNNSEPTPSRPKHLGHAPPFPQTYLSRCRQGRLACVDALSIPLSEPRSQNSVTYGGKET